jgi:drug/metabolite transporter (DMT)-like permease
MLHVPTILLGTLAGGGILALMNYLNFSAVVKITTENITAIMALSPVTTLAFQEIGVALGLIAVARPAPGIVAAMAVIVVAVLVIFWSGRRSRLGEAATRRALDCDP